MIRPPVEQMINESDLRPVVFGLALRGQHPFESFRPKHDIELTRPAPGHSDIGTGEIYAERDLAAAERVMRETAGDGVNMLKD